VKSIEFWVLFYSQSYPLFILQTSIYTSEQEKLYPDPPYRQVLRSTYCILSNWVHRNMSSLLHIYNWNVKMSWEKLRKKAISSRPPKTWNCNLSCDMYTRLLTILAWYASCKGRWSLKNQLRIRINKVKARVTVSSFRNGPSAIFVEDFLPFELYRRTIQ
jgi:hypothetical protein